MKNLKSIYKAILITLLLLNSFNGKAQWVQCIDSLKIIPSIPTNMDSIKLISYCTLGCVQYDNSVISNNNSLVYVYTYYTDSCPLVETYTTRIDTIFIGKLDAGVYKIIQFLNVRDQYPDTTYTYVTFDSDTIEFTILSIESISYQGNIISIFPNPVSDFVNIEINNKLSPKDFNIEIINIKGQVIFSKSNVKNSIQIGLSDYMAGIYFISVKYKDKIIQSRKIIVK